MFANLNYITSAPQVAALRKVYNADLVALLEPPENLGGVCGMGWLPDLPLSLGDYVSAFSVTNGFCAQVHYTFPHELGHNFGLYHDRYILGEYNVDTNCAYGYFVFEFGTGTTPTPKDIVARTVMANPSFCFENEVECNRVPFYSNVFLNSETTWTGRNCTILSTDPIIGSANNARFFEESASVVCLYHYIL